MKNGTVEFISPLADKALSSLGEKMPLVEKRSAAEISANQKLDKELLDAFWAWRGKTIGKDTNQVLRTPDNMEFTIDELDLAGWIHEYADRAGTSFSNAMEKVFDYLKRNPKLLEHYTNGDANFAESASGSVSAVIPKGFSVDPQTMEVFRRARVYQAGHSGCELSMPSAC